MHKRLLVLVLLAMVVGCASRPTVLTNAYDGVWKGTYTLNSFGQSTTQYITVNVKDGMFTKNLYFLFNDSTEVQRVPFEMTGYITNEGVFIDSIHKRVLAEGVAHINVTLSFKNQYFTGNMASGTFNFYMNVNGWTSSGTWKLVRQ